MKKNITINLCGRLVQIDEDAYELLQQYIESLRQSFGHEAGGEEILQGRAVLAARDGEVPVGVAGMRFHGGYLR